MGRIIRTSAVNLLFLQISCQLTVIDSTSRPECNLVGIVGTVIILLVGEIKALM